MTQQAITADEQANKISFWNTHDQYSPGLAPFDYCLFGQLKYTL